MFRWKRLSETFKHSRSILRFMLHLCFLGGMWMIQWLLRACLSFAWLLAYYIDLICESGQIMRESFHFLLLCPVFPYSLDILLLSRLFKVRLLSWVSSAGDGLSCWLRNCQTEQHAGCSLTESCWVVRCFSVKSEQINKWNLLRCLRCEQIQHIVMDLMFNSRLFWHA